MRRLRRFYASVIGKKAIVAVTGAIMLLFLVGHVTGNLKVFLPDIAPGVPDIDAYAEFLRTVGEPLVPHMAILWAVRLVLLAAVALHVVCVVQLVRHNRAARGEGYRRRRYDRATRPARWMMVSGLVVLGFIVFHILHFTTGTIDPASFREGEVYANLYA
ncbi:MAG: succinate dehydrogenase, partial [Gemmatimonadota bacterium]|nr:succinate dehydrogenase [Gemmatimonadota bacterium]